MQATTKICKMLGIPEDTEKDPETPEVISAIHPSIPEQKTTCPKHTSEEHDNAVCSTSWSVDDSNSSNLLGMNNCEQSVCGQSIVALQNLFISATSCVSTSSALDDKQLVISKVENLTPKQKKGPGKVFKLKSALRKSRKVSVTLRKLTRHWSVVEDLDDKYNSLQVDFIKSQFNNVTGENPKWTFENKVVALTLYNRDPKRYILLSRHVELPPKSTLEKFLKNLSFETGINKALFDQLKARVSKMSRKTRITKLMFDEIPLSTGLSRSCHSDSIVGYEDLGSLGRTNRLANRALVFMAEGLNSSWQQPVAYFFAKDAVTPENLKVLILEVVSNLQAIGLQVVCTVCEMSANNVRAIDLLKHERKTNEDIPSFIVNKRRVVVLFDPPHLLVATRDAFAKYAVRYEGTKMAKFKYLLIAHERDSAEGERWRMLYKIRKCYLHPHRYKKLKTRVSVAAKTLCHKMAGMLKLFSMVSSNDIEKEEFIQTGVFVWHIDSLFDSFNAEGMKPEQYEYTPPLRCVLDRKSPHVEFWKDMLQKIQSWEFVDEDGVKQKPTVPVKEGYINNIKAVLWLWERCKKAGIRSLRTRKLNKEPIKHLFAPARLYGRVAVNDPTPSQFTFTLKTSLFK